MDSSPETNTWAAADDRPALVSTPHADYQALVGSAGLADRSDRTWLIAAGRDRAAWLHNLVTNAIKPLNDGQGCYAFACDVRGRLVADMNILAIGDELWLDVSRATATAIHQHLDRYLITEDVRWIQPPERARIGVSGPRAAEIAAALGVGDLAIWPALAHRPLAADGSAAVDHERAIHAPPASPVDNGATVPTPSAPRLIRHDFAGDLAFELLVAASERLAWWERLRRAGAIPVGTAALDVRRIERGVPAWGRELTEQVVAPESGQAHRAINYHKGCYLGQEVIERMRSHNILARRLVGIEIDAGDGLELPAPLRAANAEVGRVTSLCRHPQRGVWIGLGYLKANQPAPSVVSVGDPPRACRCEPLAST